MGQHRALRAPGSARGIEDRREIVGLAARPAAVLRSRSDALEKAAIPFGAENFDPAQPEPRRERAHAPSVEGRRASARGRVGEKIFEFGERVGGV